MVLLSIRVWGGDTRIRHWYVCIIDPLLLLTKTSGQHRKLESLNNMNILTIGHECLILYPAIKAEKENSCGDLSPVWPTPANTPRHTPKGGHLASSKWYDNSHTQPYYIPGSNLSHNEGAYWVREIAVNDIVYRFLPACSLYRQVNIENAWRFRRHSMLPLPQEVSTSSTQHLAANKLKHTDVRLEPIRVGNRGYPRSRKIPHGTP